MSRSFSKQAVLLQQKWKWNYFAGGRQWIPPSHSVRRQITTAEIEQPKVQPKPPSTAHQEPTAERSVPRQRLSRLRHETDPPPLSSYLTDTFSRSHNYLRISVTERCNLRCIYCMPEDGVPLSPPAHLLTTPEIVYLSQLFVSQGVNKIRLTGGEPTIRKDIVDLMRQIGHLKRCGLQELCITTNGLTLQRKLDAMVEAGLTGVNLSLDTLDPYQFTIMTRRNGHESVMRTIDRILDMKRVGAPINLKVNCVVMRSINDRQIIPFVELGREKDLEVRFIEYMPFEGNRWSEKKMLSFQEMLTMIREKYPTLQKIHDHANDTSKTYQIPGFLGRIGFVTSMTNDFCGTCNRLRITTDGNLKVCLFGNSEVSLRDVLRQSNNGQPWDDEALHAINQAENAVQDHASGQADGPALLSQRNQLLDLIGAAVNRKKAKHAGIGELQNMKNRPMILIDDCPPSPTSILLPSQPTSLVHNSPWSRHHLRATSTLHGASRQLRLYNTQQGNEVVPGAHSTFPDPIQSVRRIPSRPGFRKISALGNPSWVGLSETSTDDEPTNLNGKKPQTVLFGLPKHLRYQKDGSSRGRRSLNISGFPLDSAVRKISMARLSPGSRQLSKDQPSQDQQPPHESSGLPPLSRPKASASLEADVRPNRQATPETTTGANPPESSSTIQHALPSKQVSGSKKRARHPGVKKTSCNTALGREPKQRRKLGRLSHLSSSGQVRMVDISGKISSLRSAAAQAFVLFSNDEPCESLVSQSLPKGDAMAVARIAGIQAAKKTADLIPLAHPALDITGVDVDIEFLKPTSWNSDNGDAARAGGEAGFEFGGVKITALVSCRGRTGVEMEALTAANAAALTMYDMCKAVDKHMLITGVQVIMKKGGKSRDWNSNADIPDDPFLPPDRRSESLRPTPSNMDVSEYKRPSTTPAPISRPASSASASTSTVTTAIPKITPTFFQSASDELDLFVANTTSPTKAAEIAGLRRRHQALALKIKDQQRLADQGLSQPRVDSCQVLPSNSHLVERKSQSKENNGGSEPKAHPPKQRAESASSPPPPPWPAGLRSDFDALQSLLCQKRQVARQVLGWRMGGGSLIKEADAEDASSDESSQTYNYHDNDNGNDGDGISTQSNGDRGHQTSNSNAMSLSNLDWQDPRSTTTNTTDSASPEVLWRWEGGVYGPHLKP